MNERVSFTSLLLVLLLIGSVSVMVQANVRADTASDTVTVSIPNVWALPGQTIIVPVAISAVETKDSIYSLQGSVTYDDSILTAVDVTKEHTLTEIWTLLDPISNVIGDSLVFAFPGEYPIEGSGALVTLIFEVADSADSGQTSPIHFDSFSFNEGVPYSMTHDALFTVGEGSQISVSESEHNFGAVEEGDTAEWQFSVSNRGVADLIIVDIYSDSVQFGIESMAFPVTLPSGESQDVGVTFWPIAEDSFAGSLRITCNDPQQPIAVITLSGIGTAAVTAIEDPFGSNRLPDTYKLFQNHPNPFNASTQISFQLPVVSGQSPTTSGQYSVISDQSLPHVTLRIYNVLGQEVRTLVNEVQKPGYYSVTWDAKDEMGREVGSGIYLYRLKAGNFIERKRMVYVR